MLLSDTGTTVEQEVIYACYSFTEFELNQINAIKARLQADKIYIPDREILKFLNANFYDLNKAKAQLSSKFKWLSEVADVKINPQIIRLIQSGSIYIFGRDKDYKITIVLDLPKIIPFSKTE